MDDYTAAGLSNDWPARINALREKFAARCVEAKGFDVVTPDRSTVPFGFGEGPDEGWATDEYRRVHGLGVADDLEGMAAADMRGGPTGIELRDGTTSPEFELQLGICHQEAEAKVEEAHRLWFEATGAGGSELDALYASDEWVREADAWRRCMAESGFDVGSPQGFVNGR